ncbi:uncharacterized protein LOC143031298 [Oratosquilla oratoria]|uniref:uncharacterized protein LOC143031298 n=1 Tax=Oratosquilla oratoria TaxID=337810 RepID=UPI003F7606A1
MQIHGPILALGEFASSMKSLQQLNKEMNEGFAKSGASTTSAFQQEESGVKKQNTSVPLTRTVTSSRPRVFAQSDPASLSSNQTACLDLPEDLGAHCTTHLKIVTTKVNNNSKGFWVTYVGGAGQTIFLINCDLNADQLHLRIWDLTPGQRQMKEQKKSQAGLQWGTDHRFTIIHDPAQYAILLDGTVVGYVKKRNSHNQVTKIKVGSWSSTKVDVSMSSVETD